MNLPQEFTARMKAVLGDEYEEFLKSYDLPAEKGIRINTLKISEEEFLKNPPLELDGKVPWEPCGYYVNCKSAGKTVEHAAGAYYVQEPSAMCVVPELDIEEGDRVLDMCAAPGGKSTQIAQKLNLTGLLVSNEIDRKRYLILKSNIERMGVKNALVSNSSPEEIAEAFGGYFNKVLVDAPCSGEGMFKKEPEAIPEWSLDNVARSAARQAKILDCADKTLSVGGTLVYSTCTFAPEEDEKQIESFLKKYKNYELVKIKKLFPHKVRGDGHFCAKLIKTDGEEGNFKFKPLFKPTSKNRLIEYREWEKETLNIKIDEVFGENFLYSYCKDMPSIGGAVGGVVLNNYNQKRFEPSHTLAMCLKESEAKHIEVDRATALAYLRGLTFECNEKERGWRLVTFNKLPLGWCKASNGIAKNHLPKGLRI